MENKNKVSKENNHALTFDEEEIQKIKNSIEDIDLDLEEAIRLFDRLVENFDSKKL